MAVTVEELQIVYLADIKNALDQTRKLREQIKKTMEEAMKPVKTGVDAVKKATQQTGEAVAKANAKISEANAKVQVAQDKVRASAAKTQAAMDKAAATSAKAQEVVRKTTEAATAAMEKQRAATEKAKQTREKLAAIVDRATHPQVPDLADTNGPLHAPKSYKDVYEGQYNEIRKAAGFSPLKEKPDTSGVSAAATAATTSWQRAQQTINSTLEAVKQKIHNVFSNVKVRVDSAEVDESKAKLTAVNQRLENQRQIYKALLAAQHEAAATQGESSLAALRLEKQLLGAESAVDKLNAEASKLEAELQAAGRSGGTAGQKVAKGFSIAKSMIQKVSSALGKFANGVKNVAGRAMSGFTSKVKSTTKSVSALGKRLKGMLVSMLFFKAISGITTSLKDGMQNMAQGSERANATLSALSSSFLYLKNSVAAAFMPALQALQPVITVITNALASLMNMIAAVTSRLFGGASTFVRAKKVQTDYAASLGKTGDSAKKAAKDAQGALASFDELNIIGQKNTADAASGGAGGAAQPGDMFETVEIPAETLSFVDEIKKAIENGDWAGVGTLLGNKVNSIVAGIDFAGLGTKVGGGIQAAISTAYNFLSTIDFDQIGVGVGTFLNGAMAKIDFTMLGRTLAKGWTISTDFLYGFVTTFDWSMFGISISNAINGFFGEVDWAKAGTTMSLGVRGILKSIKEAIANTNWEEIGHDIYIFLASIDWGGIVSDLAYVIGQAIGGLGLLLWGFIKDEWGKLVGWWYDNAFEDGKFTITGLLSGIWEAMKGIGSWLWNHICQPIIDGVKSMFGINSPSTVFAEIGKYLIEGLLGGLSETWSTIETFFKTACKVISDLLSGDFESALNGIKDIFSGIGDVIENVFVAILGEDAVNAIKDFISEWCTKISDWWTNDVKPWFTLEKWKELFGTIKQGLVDKWNETVKWWSELGPVKWIEKYVKPLFKSETWEGYYNNVKTALSNVRNNLVTWWKDEGGGKWIDDHVVPLFKLKTWEGYYENIKTALYNTFKNGINGVIGLVNKFIGWLNDAMHFEWDAITILGKEIVPAGSIQLFTIPPIKPLAKGGVLRENSIVNVAEYPGATSNPEIVAPQAIMRETFLDAVWPLVDAVLEGSDKVRRAVEDKDLNTYLDGVRVSRQLDKPSKRVARQKGKSLVVGG